MLDIILPMLSWFWGLFVGWLYLFASPIWNFQVMWIIIPIWLAWFFGEFFQEKKGTSFGNAISNGVVPFWVGLDWMRLLVNGILEGKMAWSPLLVFKFLICLGVFAYGAFILVQGVRGRNIVRYVGRIREITYAMVVFTPIIYGIVPLSMRYFLSIAFFFPVFYFLMELIDLKMPNPKAFDMDESPHR